MLSKKLIKAAAGAGGAEETDPNFNQTVLLLHGDGTNGAQNNTFLDSSTNNFTITRNGNTTQGTFSPFSAPDGRWSNYFDGTSDNLSVANNAAFQFGTGDFTVEAWIYQTVSRAEVQTIVKCATDSSWDPGWALALGSATPGQVVFWVNNSFVSTSGASTATLNAWNHVAVSRSGTTLKMFINGVEVDSDTNSTNIVPTAALTIGADITSSNYEFQGYLSNVRVIKGTALYTGAFTPSTSPLTAVSGTSLLTCQSNRFVDNSTNAFAITRNGDVKVTPFSPFAPTAAYSASVNGGSGYFDGTGDYLSLTGTSLGSGNFTVEGWVYLEAAGTSVIFFDSRANDTSNTGFAFYRNSSNYLAFFTNLTATAGTTVVPLNSWVHVALVRNSGTVYGYMNGVQQFSVANSATMSLTAWKVFSQYDGTNPPKGNLSEFRITTTAVYTSAFTPPTAPLTAITGTQLLLNFTNAGIYNNALSGGVNLETVGNAQIDTTTKKYGTGSMEFDGTGDGLFIPATQDLAFGTGNFTVEFWINFSSLTGTPNILDMRPPATQGAYLNIYAGSSKIGVFVSSADLIVGNTTLSTGVWYHVALVRSSGTTSLYLNGTSDATPVANTTNYLVDRLVIGIDRGLSSNPLTGFIDDLRITKGVARYTANFTPPTKAFPDL